MNLRLLPAHGGIELDGEATQDQTFPLSVGHREALLVEHAAFHAWEFSASSQRFTHDLRMLPDDEKRLSVGHTEKEGKETVIAVRDPALSAFPPAPAPGRPGCARSCGRPRRQSRRAPTPFGDRKCTTSFRVGLRRPAWQLGQAMLRARQIIPIDHAHVVAGQRLLGFSASCGSSAHSSLLVAVTRRSQTWGSMPANLL